ncbi:DUF2294 domain-containing protein [Aquibacillus koreensis]|uniref:DUF2294 domain-containing protein n=1 Tax=Aquibacillus koreensis TaxID=279446 RepID=A0A9X3WNC3_9BACI|nr:DUF2294 domain-containing protein [Aquibacillus koreensis]MCT2534466.1 DUF2294 domain-containing protein [Aquibacillus koreensis]MDC3421773.1 DUF2294 domain-containing protein [Aquibacillus koreensis]
MRMEGLKQMDQSDVTARVSSYISKTLRDNFGKGPESVHTSINDMYITIYIRNFVSPTEKVLLTQRNQSVVEETRDLVMSTLIPEIKANLLQLTGMSVDKFFYDWSLHNKSAMFTCISSEDTKSDIPLRNDYKGKEGVEKEVIHLSKVAQRVPDELKSFLLNNRTLLIIRNGILVNIEKQLIRDGYQETLKLAKRKLEKKLLHNNSYFDQHLETRVVDIFVDWDFDDDKSVILFILNPTK